MRFQVFFASVLLLGSAPALADTTCFDFGAAVTKPLKEPPTDVSRPRNGQDESASGTTPHDSDVTWAWVRGVVKKPIEQVYALLLDHNTTKSPKAEIEVEKIESPIYLALHRVKFTIRPFPLVRVQWIEDWAYALAAGSREHPETIVISYQKTEGTTHIRELCGSVVLRKVSEKTTDLYEYEQAKATRRSVVDTLNGVKGTLATLRR